MTRAGGTGSAPPGAPCSYTPLREQRGDSTGFVASEEVRTLPEVSLPSLSTPPAPASGHPLSRHGVGAAQPRERLPPARLPGTSMERARRVAKESGEWPRSKSPDRDRLPVPAVRRRGAAASPRRCSVPGKPRQPGNPCWVLEGSSVTSVLLRFFPVARSRVAQDRRSLEGYRLGAGSSRGAAWQDGCGGAGRSKERCVSRAGLAGSPRGQRRRQGQVGS